ncbi:MAG: hypothetical protein ACOCXH_15535, partial [Cyclobacteriaceae bacterium]
MRCLLFVLFVFVAPFISKGQEKKILDHSDYKRWREIKGSEISGNGNFVLYRLGNERVDPELKIQDLQKNNEYHFARGTNGNFSYDSEYAFFMIKPPYDSLQELRRRKTKEEKLPKDTLVIFYTASGETTMIPRVQSYKIPGKGSGWLAYLLEAVQNDTTQSDTARAKVKMKKESKKNGYQLVLRELASAYQDTFKYVTEYNFSEDGSAFMFHSTGDDSLFLPGVYRFDLTARELQPMMRGKGTFKQMAISDDGDQLAFLAHQDTVKNRLLEVFSLYHWQAGKDSATMIVDSTHARMPGGWLLNQFHKLT